MDHIKLYLSPNNHTTQEHLLNRIASLKQEQPLLSITLLLPTTQAVFSLRRRTPQMLGLHILQFYALAESILERAALPVTRIYEASVRELVASLLERLHQNGELTTFDTVWEKPGFTQVIIEWLREMKTQGIHPQEFSKYAENAGGERDRQLSLIYQSYQSYLQERQLTDADGLLWLAAEALESDALLGESDGYLYISGFDQFNLIQMRLLRTLCKRYAQATLYLQWDTARGNDSLALARMLDTRLELEEGLNAEIHTLPDTSDVHAAVHDLRLTLFESDRPSYTAGNELPIHTVEAPSREAELRWALHKVKRLLLEGVSPHDIIMLAPQPQVYHPFLQTISEEYGLPIQTQDILADNPAISALTNVLRLAPEFPWRTTLDALRSPYVDQPWLNWEQIDLLDQLSRERPVIAGREQWQFALQPVELPAVDPEDEDLGPPPLVSQIPPDRLKALEEGLMAFFDHLTPLESASHFDYALWVQEACLGIFPETESVEDATSLNMLVRCRDQPDFSWRDLTALAMLLEVLRGMISGAQVIMPESQLLTWDAFRAKLIRNLSIPIPHDFNLPMVQFAPLEAGREIAIDYLIVLGISEGEFPQPPPPDALYSPGERDQHPLPLLRYRPAGDASLWWQVISSFRRELYLLRPRLDENGAPWLPSPYWDEVLDKIPDAEVESIPIGYQPDTHQACSPAELMLALGASHAQTVPPELNSQWQAAQAAQSVLQQRHSWGTPGVFEGYIQDPLLQMELSQRYNPSHAWSVSKLNSYGNCPYGFFAQAVLELEARPDPEEGLNPMQRGSLLHAMLELLFQQLTLNGLTLTTQNQPAILTHLDEVCQEIFPAAPLRYGFRPSALWHHEKDELRRLVVALISWECEENGLTPRFRPYQQEMRFGIHGAQLPKLRLDPRMGESFYVHGIIDRLDQDDAGGLRIIDYKSGSSTFSEKDIRNGYALQTALYALAAEQLIPAAGHVVESYYLHIPTRQKSGKLSFDGSGTGKAIVEQAVEVSARFISQIRRGIFLSAPGKPTIGARACRDKCDFAALCRVTRQSIGKARRALT